MTRQDRWEESTRSVAGHAGRSARASSQEVHDRIVADTAAIQQRLADWGVSDSHARGLAALAAQRGDPPTYIADLLAYVTSTPDVQNPLALFDHLCRNGLTRSRSTLPAARDTGLPERCALQYARGDHPRGPPAPSLDRSRAGQSAR